MILQPLRPVLSPIARSVAGAARGRLSNPSLMLEFAGEAYAMGAADAPLSARAFSDLITFTRASGGGRFNAQGVYEWLPADQPRIDYDPVTGEAKGLLIEEQRTNLLTESEFRNGVTDAPIRGGLISATSFAGFAGGIAFGRDGVTYSYAYKSFAHTNGVEYTLSLFVRMDDGGEPKVGSAAADELYDFKLMMFGSWLGNAPTISAMGGGLYRVQATRVSTGTSPHFGVVKYAGNSPRTFKVTGYMLEVGSFPTSYIPTTGAQVTRAADIASVNELSPWYNPEQGTLFVEADRYSIKQASNFFAGIGSSSTSYFAVGYASAVAGDVGRGYINSAAVGGLGNQYATSPVTINPGAAYKYALAINGVDNSYAVNGQLGSRPGSFATNKMPTASLLEIGRSHGGPNPMNGHIRSIRYWPKRLSNSELQALTA